MNLPAARARRALTTLVTVVVATLLGVVPCFVAPARIAMAEDGDAANSATQADGTTQADSASDTTGTDSSTADPSPTVNVTIDDATAVVTATSGYHLKATVNNPTEETLPAGTLTLATNARFTFFSRTDMQEWSEGTANIPARDILGNVDVPELAAGASATVEITVKPDELSAIVSWGPKPLALVYVAGERTQAITHSFLTRSTDGLNNASTPAMRLTVALPLASTSWELDETAVDSVIAGGSAAAGAASGKSGSAAAGAANGEASGAASSKSGTSTNASLITLGDDAQLDRKRLQTITNHPMLQVIADPTTLDAMDMPPQIDGIMQPAAFDITSFVAYANSGAYENAGVNGSAWNADAAIADYRSAIGDQDATSTTYAMQGDAAWSLASLTAARTQGYTTVIADHEFDTSDNSTVHTGKIVVPTDAGDVTVLTEQRELSRLAQGKATSSNADGETTAAGRLARFVAQSAFYQMEQPYTTRNLLVCFEADADAATIDALMNAVEHSPWLELTDLATLSQADATATGDDALQLVHDKTALTTAQTQRTQQTLSSLAASRDAITRFASQVVDNNSDGAQAWGNELIAAQSSIAMRAMAGDAQAAKRMTTAASSLATQLADGVTITQSEPVTVVSETATMPVTIRNQHPYPVRVKVSSLTDSPEIITSRISEASVPPHGETQVTFTIRVLASGTTTAHISLQDRTGQPFGTTQSTNITSVLRISDKSGFVIIAFAIVLGLLGLWRQFNRKKDPDE
ncbi:hypothetical protein BHAP_0003 [Bifidobacterium hapali]|uniref:Uncharacterized protein n=1 Tax=Bifidobacterium hapali TaxID=1630172 RepID=A0A261G639_9BIFI|nr:hypothetical protein BHAP_0003 [Bifidobacterium hapali]